MLDEDEFASVSALYSECLGLRRSFVRSMGFRSSAFPWINCLRRCGGVMKSSRV
jgi:hypothetical protein